MTETAIFAGGCFWCLHAAFEQLDGVTKVVSGYTGGHVPNPSYEQVSGGATGHVEAIEVVYDPARVPYTQLLKYFWENVDPTDPTGQFCDKGSEYLAGIFYNDDAQRAAAEKSVTEAEKILGQKVATFLRPAEPFYEAEEYHQSYYKKNELRYQLYKMGCGRDKTLAKVWGQKQQA
jgi:methionine-S-sulfoxide reductase